MKYSRQRDIVLKTVLNNHIHPTAEQVYQMVRKDHSKMSLATVYRNLNQLTEMHAVRKVSVIGEADRFDGNLSAHCHMVCVRCGEITDLKTDALADVDNLVSEETGEVILSHTIMFNGVCKSCEMEG